MIKHHPKFELILAYVKGDLPVSLSAAITIHADVCAECKNTITQLTKQIADASFEQDYEQDMLKIDNVESDEISVGCDSDFNDMIDNITQSSDIDEMQPVLERTVEFKNTTYAIPKALNNIELGRITEFGKLARTRLMLDEDEIHTNLLHVAAGGHVPQHTHKGFELTLLLDGSFSDGYGEYVKGDFIMLDGSHEHHPISQQGCLCYTVANDALHFTQGINKLLNPIGSLLY